MMAGIVTMSHKAFTVPLFNCGKVYVCATRKAFLRIFNGYSTEPLSKKQLRTSAGKATWARNEAGSSVYIIDVFDGGLVDWLFAIGEEVIREQGT